MTDIKEAQGLEVFTVPGRYLAVNRKNPGAQDVVLLSDATAVIDQLRAELAEVKVELALALKTPSIAAMHTWLDSECAKKSKQLETELAALKAKAVIPEKARDALARRCLWIAYVWNDINFLDAKKYAKKEAESHGITSFDEANEWLEAQQQNNGVIVPRAIAERMAIDAAQYEHEHAVVNDNVQLWQQPGARLTLTVGDLRTVRALLGGDHE